VDSQIFKEKVRMMFKKREAAEPSAQPAFSVEQISWTSAVVVEALVRILDKKGFVTKEELLDEVKEVQAQVRQQMGEQA
jgi:hypothetical protein